MIYKNTKTGAILDSPCTISGGDWLPLEEAEKVSDTEKVEGAETPGTEEANTEAEPEELSKLKKEDIINELKAFGVEFDPKASKAELYSLMVKSK